MSFMEILKQAREEAKQNKAASTLMECAKDSEKDLDLEDIFGKKIEEDTTLPPPVPPVEEDKKEEVGIIIGDKIMETSARALTSKLKGTGAAKRLAKAISVKKHISTAQLEKAFAIQKRFRPSHINYKLVGGDAMKQLKTLLENGATLGAALQTIYKEKP